MDNYVNHIKETIHSINSRSGTYWNPNKNNATTILYISPLITGVGLYRAILPFWVINKTSTHRSEISSLECYDPNNRKTGFKININEEQIKRADYIVFQTSFHNLQEHISMFREINTKSHLKFAMDIDDNYHIVMPGENPKTAKQMRDQLLKNMNACDFVVCENHRLKEFYEPITHVEFKLMPNLLHDDCLKVEEKLLESKKIRIGMIFNPTQFFDVKIIHPVLKYIQEKHKEVQLVLFGWNCKITGKYLRNALPGINYEYHAPVPIYDYFEKLKSLKLNMALMPLQDNEFNKCKSFHKILQYAQSGIYPICSKVEPYTRSGLYIDTCKNEEDFIKALEHNFNRPPTEIALINENLVQENYTWHNHKNIDLLKNLFK